MTVGWHPARRRSSSVDTGKLFRIIGLHEQSAGTSRGFFYFFNPQILELLVKIVNGCSLNGAYWFFYGSTSNVALQYTVEDLKACKTKTVNVPLGQFAANGDVEFFGQSCP